MELQAVGWRDQTGDLPLIYRFGYRRADSRADAIVWLTAPSHQPAASVVVPLSAGNRLIPLAAVCDTRLGCAMIESTALAPEQGGSILRFILLLLGKFFTDFTLIG